MTSGSNGSESVGTPIRHQSWAVAAKFTDWLGLMAHDYLIQLKWLWSPPYQWFTGRNVFRNRTHGSGLVVSLTGYDGKASWTTVKLGLRYSDIESNYVKVVRHVAHFPVNCLRCFSLFSRANTGWTVGHGDDSRIWRTDLETSTSELAC